jgi:hypothetical protein
LDERATSNEIAIVADTMDALKRQAAGSKQINIWDANAAAGHAGNFQIIRCKGVAGKVVLMGMAAVQFTARTNHGGFL